MDRHRSMQPAIRAVLSLWVHWSREEGTLGFMTKSREQVKTGPCWTRTQRKDRAWQSILWRRECLLWPTLAGTCCWNANHLHTWESNFYLFIFLCSLTLLVFSSIAWSWPYTMDWVLDKFDGKSADGCMPANYLLLCIIIIRTIDSCDGVFGCFFFKRVNWEMYCERADLSETTFSFVPKLL